MLRAADGISGSLAAAARGLAVGQARFENASGRVVAELSPEALVDQKLAQAQIAASARVLRTADELTGTLIDTIA
jgi:hypothetical protein